jgi:hypothetical protein
MTYDEAAVAPSRCDSTDDELPNVLFTENHSVLVPEALPSTEPTKGPVIVPDTYTLAPVHSLHLHCSVHTRFSLYTNMTMTALPKGNGLDEHAALTYNFSAVKKLILDGANVHSPVQTPSLLAWGLFQTNRSIPMDLAERVAAQPGC